MHLEKLPENKYPNKKYPEKNIGKKVIQMSKIIKLICVCKTGVILFTVEIFTWCDEIDTFSKLSTKLKWFDVVRIFVQYLFF